MNRDKIFRCLDDIAVAHDRLVEAQNKLDEEVMAHSPKQEFDPSEWRHPSQTDELIEYLEWDNDIAPNADGIIANSLKRRERYHADTED